MNGLIDNVIDWANDKGLFVDGSPEAQLRKLREEVDELDDAMHSGSLGEVELELGDCLVVLIVLAEMQGLDVECCLEEAYQKISKRTGKMVDGFFVKDS